MINKKILYRVLSVILEVILVVLVFTLIITNDAITSTYGNILLFGFSSIVLTISTFGVFIVFCLTERWDN